MMPIKKAWLSAGQWLRRPVPLVLVAAVGVIALLTVLLGPVAYWATATVNELSGKDKADAINSTRQILLAAAAGSAALAGLAFTGRNYYLSRRGQYTDRFGKAIAQLAADKMTERLGGIYALENIMVESDRDHATIVEVLAAFVRERTGSNEDMRRVEVEHVHEGPQPAYRTLATDVQAALTVLGRRPLRTERTAVNLRLTDLCGADLTGLRLDGAVLWGAYLQHAIMHDVRLRGAILSYAQLQDSRLGGADLRGAALDGARMQDVTLDDAQLSDAQMYLADLRGANLQDADLRRAHLGEANLRALSLRGADLRGADLVSTTGGIPGRSYGLTARRLARTRMDEHTVLPTRLRRQLLQYQRQRLHRALLVHLKQRQLAARRAGDAGVG